MSDRYRSISRGVVATCMLLMAAVDSITALDGPCDIYAMGNTPCVAAHSLTRALYGSYNGPLYAVRKGSDEMDIGVVAPGGVANTSAHDAFCGETPSTCVVQRIYDQSPMQNHLGIEHGASNLGPPRNTLDRAVNFTDPRSRAMLGGHPVYAAFFEGRADQDRHYIGQGYSNRTATGTARDDDPQSMYAVFGGRHYNHGCCFDYGNAENVTGKPDGTGHSGPMSDGTMEAIYFGSAYGPNGPGSGSGPWIGADMENGIYEGGSSHASSPSLLPTDFVVGFVKGNSGNHYSIKAGDPQKAGSLHSVYDGPRPRGYEVMKKQGAIILGIGGDNSPWGAGIFYEGVMTTGYASNATEAAVMANIVAAGYATMPAERRT